MKVKSYSGKILFKFKTWWAKAVKINLKKRIKLQVSNTRFIAGKKEKMRMILDASFLQSTNRDGEFHFLTDRSGDKKQPLDCPSTPGAERLR